MKNKRMKKKNELTFKCAFPALKSNPFVKVTGPTDLESVASGVIFSLFSS